MKHRVEASAMPPNAEIEDIVHVDAATPPPTAPTEVPQMGTSEADYTPKGAVVADVAVDLPAMTNGNGADPATKPFRSSLPSKPEEDAR